MKWAEGRAKLKPACQEERLLKWKEHFKNLLKKPSCNHRQNDQLNIKLGQFMKEELDSIEKNK